MVTIADLERHLTPELRAQRQEMLQKRGLPTLGFYEQLMAYPELFERLQALGTLVRFQSVLPPRVREAEVLMAAVEQRSAFEWQTQGHGVLRSLALYQGRVGLLVEEPAVDSTMVFHDVAEGAGPSFPLSRPFLLSPCAAPTAADGIALVDAWLVPRLSFTDTRLSASLELAGGRSCVRSVESMPWIGGEEPAFSLRAVDARTLSGTVDDGARTQSVECTLR